MRTSLLPSTSLPACLPPSLTTHAPTHLPPFLASIPASLPSYQSYYYYDILLTLSYRKATRTIYHIRTKLVDVIVLHCCDGWKEGKQGSGVCDQGKKEFCIMQWRVNIPFANKIVAISTAYCNKQCQNGGTCIGGKHKCHCPKQWTGDLCQTGIYN